MTTSKAGGEGKFARADGVWVVFDGIRWPEDSHETAALRAGTINAAFTAKTRGLVEELKRLRGVVSPVDVESIDMVLEDFR